MLSTSFMLLVSGALLMLRLGETAASFPRPLSAAEEKKALEEWMQGDIEARNRLIEHNLRLVVHIVKKYYSANADTDDLISIGTFGLIKGINSFRPDKGVRLATYASKCIENEILMYFRSCRKTAQNISLTSEIESETGEGGGLSLLDTLSVPDDMLETISNAEQSGLLHQAVKTYLNEREAAVITMRYGLDGVPPLPQRKVADILGISRSYISRIEKKALEKLKTVMDPPEKKT